MVYFSYFLMTLLLFSGLFLIGLILLQRGRGGGLAGAFGGMGGQSAFGTKAGDVFTRITIGVAAAWILLCAGSVVALHHSSTPGARTDSSIFKKDDAGDKDKDGVGDATSKAKPKDDLQDDDGPPPAAKPNVDKKPGTDVKDKTTGTDVKQGDAVSPETPTSKTPGDAKGPEKPESDSTTPADPKPKEGDASKEDAKPVEKAPDPKVEASPEKKPE